MSPRPSRPLVIEVERPTEPTLSRVENERTGAGAAAVTQIGVPPSVIPWSTFPMSHITAGSAPGGPGGPTGPSAPRSPAAPGAPGAPVSPLSPLSPFGPCGPGSPLSPFGPGGPGGPWVSTGSNVTLRSLLPATTVTVRVSGCQPEPGICTVTVWSPSVRLMLIGVTLPVFTPSTMTCAPDGNDVTFSTPAARSGAAPTNNSAPTTAPTNAVLALITTSYWSFATPSATPRSVRMNRISRSWSTSTKESG